MRLTILLLLLLTVNWTQAQTFQQIAAGENYIQQSYLTLSTGEIVQIAHDSWDLAFTALGLQDGGIHVNESSELTEGEEASTVLLYLAESTDFESVNAVSEGTMNLLNSEANWLDGAANTVRNYADPSDYGWGKYSPAINEVVGDKIYLIKLRDNTYKKFKIESLRHPNYSMRYANLDGSDEQQITISKEEFAETGLAFFSFTTGEAFQVGSYDLSISRYSTLAVNPMDETDTLEYIVTGILSGPGVTTAELREIDPTTVNADTKADFSEETHVIGHDWKTFAFIQGWIITENLSYLVKTANGELYKVVIIDFEGSTTGVATFEQTFLGTVTSTKEAQTAFESLNVFPNPTDGHIELAFELRDAQDALQIRLFNTLGQQLWQTQTRAATGLNAQRLDFSELPAGQYFLSIEAEGQRVTELVQVY